MLDIEDMAAIDCASIAARGPAIVRIIDAQLAPHPEDHLAGPAVVARWDTRRETRR